LKLNYSCFFAVTVACLGCGGGSGVRAGQGSEAPTAVGDARIAITGKPQDQTLAFDGGLSISAIAGASINSFAIFPAANLNNAPIYFTNNGALYSYSRGQVQLVYVSPDHFIFNADVSNNGKIYMNTLDPSFNYVYAKIGLDGTGYSELSSGENLGLIRVSPDGSKVVFHTAAGLQVEPSAGGSLTLIDSAGTEGSFSPDSTQVVYSKTSGSNTQLFTCPVGGGTPTQITTDTFNHSFPSYSPDGALVLCEDDSGSAANTTSYIASGANSSESYSANIMAATYATVSKVSPDGKYLAALTSSSYNGTLSACFQDYAGGDFTTISAGGSLSWPSYPAAKTFIGSGGSWYTTPAAGFIYSSYQPGFASLLAFTATTPSTATAKVTSGTGTGPVIYDLNANTITGLKYSNGYFFNPVSITPSTTDVLVSLDSTTGSITSVAPFVAVRGTSLSKSSGAGTVSYSAHFTGVWDAHGKNLAPSGASVLTLDSKKGAVVSVR